jgi:hypothetical protein
MITKELRRDHGRSHPRQPRARAGVVTAPGKVIPIGYAFPDGHVEQRKGPAVTFWLVVGKVELPGGGFASGGSLWR